MTSCKTCLDYIKNGDFCRPLSQDYQEWFSSREYFCDRTYVYGSLLFHSLNNISTHALHENTCKRHAEERQRILNHFTFLADPANINTPGYFTGSSVRRDVGYILRRNLKSQTYTLYKDSAHEEKISEVNCEVLLPVGDVSTKHSNHAAQSPKDYTELVMNTVSQKTGYPLEMLETKMIFDTDLGIWQG